MNHLGIIHFDFFSPCVNLCKSRIFNCLRPLVWSKNFSFEKKNLHAFENVVSFNPNSTIHLHLVDQAAKLRRDCPDNIADCRIHNVCNQ